MIQLRTAASSLSPNTVATAACSGPLSASCIHQYIIQYDPDSTLSVESDSFGYSHRVEVEVLRLRRSDRLSRVP